MLTPKTSMNFLFFYLLQLINTKLTTNLANIILTVQFTNKIH